MPFSLSKLFKALFAINMMYAVDPDGVSGDPPAPKPPASDPDTGKTFSYEYVKELREENKTWRLKTQEAETKATEFKTAADNATISAKSTADAATAAANDRVIRAELKAAAIAAGMVDLDALKLADLTKVKLAEDGSVEGAEALMTEMKSSKPYLFGTPNSSSQSNTPPPNVPPVAKKAMEMTAEEYSAARKAVK